MKALGTHSLVQMKEGAAPGRGEHLTKERG